MKWRLEKLDWRYGIGELVIVTAGVLIALAIGEWNDERRDRGQEQLLVENLIEGLRVDLVNLDFAADILKRKEESLLRLKAVLLDGQPFADKYEFLDDIVMGANYGWAQAVPQDTSFQEALSSGTLGLIDDAELRLNLALHFGLWEEYARRTDERETDYPTLSYRVVLRRSPEAIGSVGGPASLLRDPSLSAAEIDTMVSLALASELNEHVIAELNFARFNVEFCVQLRTATEEMIGELSSYLERNFDV